MKKLLATMLALLMALTLLPTAVFAAEPAAFPADVGSDGTYTLSSDVKLSESFTIKEGTITRQDKCGVININSSMIFDGNGKTITAGVFANNAHHIINVENGAQVTIKNLTIFGNENTRHGINVYGEGTKVTLENVTIRNCGTAAIVINKGEVTASGLTTIGNTWGAINVDNAGKLTLDTTKNLKESGKVWSELKSGSTVTITDSTCKMTGETMDYYASTVEELAPVAKIGNNLYATLKAAYNALTKGADVTKPATPQTITVLKDSSGVALGSDTDRNMNYVIDFGGYTYTITDPPVGSSELYQSQGIRVMQSSTAVFKDGTIKTDSNSFKQFVHTYGDVTFENFNVDATGSKNMLMAVEADCGTLNINGTSSIKVNKGVTGLYVAFWHNATYDGTTVNVDTTGTINGKLVYEFDERKTGEEAAKENKGILNIKNGNFEISEFEEMFTESIPDDLKVAKITITGGKFAVSPAKYVPNTGYAITLEKGAYVVSTTSAAKPDSKTETASATLNNTAIGEVADKGELTLDISTTTDVETDNQTAYDNATAGVDTENAVVVTINLTDKENTKLFTNAVAGAYAIVTVPYQDGLESVTVQYLNSNTAVPLTQVDELSELAGKSFTVNQNGFYHYNPETGVITMKLPHFSQYLLNGTEPVVNPTPTTTYTVTFNANGGTVSPASDVTDANGKLTSLPVPTRNNYSFDGWYTAANGGDQVTISTVFTADDTVYAHWTRNHYSRPSRPNTGSGSSTTTTPTVAAPKTFDAGIAVYGAMAISSVLGMGYVGKKKF